jgi:molecular chaperone GrpE
MAKKLNTFLGDINDLIQNNNFMQKIFTKIEDVTTNNTMDNNNNLEDAATTLDEMPNEAVENSDIDVAQNNDAEATADDNLAQATHKTKELEAQVTELKDKYLRLAAEFENYKRRTTRERIELLDTAAKDTIVAMLPILDDFDRAAKANETAADAQSITEGFNLIHTRLQNTLKQRGVREMDSTNAPFNADEHEAITEIPMGDDLKGKVFDTVEKGYFLNDKIIRYAKVVVGK